MWMASGDAAFVCFDELFRHHYPRVVSVLVRLTGNRGQAEELAADIFCKLPKSIHGREENPVPWIYRAAINAGLDALKTNQRRARRESTHADDAVEPQNALESLISEERRRRVRSVLGCMKPRDAEILLLRSEGLAYREIAGALGFPATSVGTLLARAEAEFERRYRARYGDQK